MAKESKTQETTIVKATPKKVDGQKDEQPRGTVKAASISQVRTLGANKQVKHQAAGETGTQTADWNSGCQQGVREPRKTADWQTDG